MPNDSPTPGQVNYEAWRATLLHTVGYWSLTMHLPWCDLHPVEQHAWEAAAAAVRAHAEAMLLRDLDPDVPQEDPDA